MKKFFLISLMISLIPVMCPAIMTRISDLTAEKQEKMKKLEKCQGTTKGLKIAGLSTLGLTAVGVAGNIAEAVVLNEYKDKVKKAESELETQQNLNKQLWAQRAAEQQTAPTSQTQQPEKTLETKFENFADCYEKCKSGTCNVKSETQSDGSISSYYVCVTESPVVAGIQLVREFQNDIFMVSDANKKINTWELTNEEMSNCENANFTDNSILCHSKSGIDYKFLFKELKADVAQPGFATESACKAECKTVIGCMQSSTTQRWSCVEDLQNNITIADYKPFTDGVKCQEYCGETCKYVAATAHSPVIYRCYKSKAQAEAEKKLNTKIDNIDKAAALQTPNTQLQNGLTAPKAGVQLPSLKDMSGEDKLVAGMMEDLKREENRDEIGEIIQDVQKCQNTCAGWGTTAKTSSPTCECNWPKTIDVAGRRTFASAAEYIAQWANVRGITMAQIKDCGRDGNNISCDDNKLNSYTFRFAEIYDSGDK